MRNKIHFQEKLRGKLSHAQFNVLISLSSLLETLNKRFPQCQALHSFQVKYVLNATVSTTLHSKRRAIVGHSGMIHVSQNCSLWINCSLWMTGRQPSIYRPCKFVCEHQRTNQLRLGILVMQLASSDSLILQVGGHLPCTGPASSLFVPFPMLYG